MSLRELLHANALQSHTFAHEHAAQMPHFPRHTMPQWARDAWQPDVAAAAPSPFAALPTSKAAGANPADDPDTASTALSSRARLLVPGPQLLESLWAAEDDFERLMAQELPERSTADISRRTTAQRNRAEEHRARELERLSRSILPARMMDTASTAAAVRPASNNTPANDLPPHASVHFAPGSVLTDSQDNIAAAYTEQLLPLEESHGQQRPPQRQPQRQQPQQSQQQQSPAPRPPHSPFRSSMDPSRRLTDPSERELQAAVAESMRPGQRFLHVAEWAGDGLVEGEAKNNDHEGSNAAVGAAATGGAATTAATDTPLSAAFPSVLLGVRPFTLPPDVLDVLDVDVDPSGRVSRFEPAAAFGRLVPMRTQHIMRHVQAATAALDNDGEADPSSSSSRSRPAAGAGPGAGAGVGVGASAGAPRRLGHNHLHSGPSFASVHRDVAVRQARECMTDMERDLETLTAQAQALSAEYQADSRALQEYQERMQKRKEACLSSQLTAVQQQWMRAQANTRQAQLTLQQIDDLLAPPARNDRTASSRSHSRPPLLREDAETEEHAYDGAGTETPRRPPHKNMVHSPIAKSNPPTVPPADAPAPLPPAVASVPAVAATAAASSNSTSRVAVSSKPKAKPRLPPSRFVKSRPPPKQLDKQLDSALSQAQKLMERFMHNIQ